MRILEKKRKNRKKSGFGTFGAFLASRNLAKNLTRRIEIFFHFRKKKVKARNLTEKEVFWGGRRSTIRGRKIDFKNSRFEK